MDGGSIPPSSTLNPLVAAPTKVLWTRTDHRSPASARGGCIPRRRRLRRHPIHVAIGGASVSPSPLPRLSAASRSASQERPQPLTASRTTRLDSPTSAGTAAKMATPRPVRPSAVNGPVARPSVRPARTRTDRPYVILAPVPRRAGARTGWCRHTDPPGLGGTVGEPSPPLDQARSKRSRFMTLVHAATKSRTNVSAPSLLA